MEIKRKYKEDPIGVILMRLAFPQNEDKEAVRKTIAFKKDIHKSAKNMYYRHKTVFDRAGIRIEDVESILTCNTYVILSKNEEMSPKILANFLHQRGTKLAKSCRTMLEATLEDVALTDDDALQDAGNPETLMMAKEEVAARSKDIQQKLVVKSADYIKKFLDKNRVLLNNSKIKPGDVLDMVNSNAIEFANQVYQNDGQIKFNDFNKFKKILSVKMSRFVKELKESNV